MKHMKKKSLPQSYGISEETQLRLFRFTPTLSLFAFFLLIAMPGLLDEFLKKRWEEQFNPESTAWDAWFAFALQTVDLIVPILCIFLFLNAFMNWVKTFRSDPTLSRTQLSIWLPYIAAWSIALLLGASRGTFPGAIISALAVLGVASLSLVNQEPAIFRSVALTVARLLVAANAILAIVRPERSFAPFAETAGGWWVGAPRLQALLPHPNTLAWILVICVIVEFFLGRRLRFVFIPIAFALLVLTGSRSSTIALVAAAVAVAATFVIFRKPQLKKVILSTFALLITGIVVFIISQASTPYAFNGRQQTWAQAISTIRAYPLWGSGPAAYLHKGENVVSVPYAHNQFLQSQAELGVLGSIALIMVIIGIWRFVFQIKFNYFGIALASGFCALLLTENILRFAEPEFNLQLIFFQLALFASVESGVFKETLKQRLR